MSLESSRSGAMRVEALPRWRCIIRNPALRRASALVFAVYLIKGLAWLGVAAWLWWRSM